MALLRVRVHIDELRPEDVGSTVRVAVMDTSMADALHPTVAEATGVVEEDSHEIDLEIEIPEGTLDEKRYYSLWGHVDHEGEGNMRSGDLITTQNIPVTNSDLVHEEEVGLESMAEEAEGGDFIQSRAPLEASLTRI